MKKLFCSILFVLIMSVPAFAILKSEWIPQVGYNTKTEESDMGEIDRALQSFASNHPDADVKSMQILYHPLSGSYDIFILYNE